MLQLIFGEQKRPPADFRSAGINIHRGVVHPERGKEKREPPLALHIDKTAFIYI